MKFICKECDEPCVVNIGEGSLNPVPKYCIYFGERGGCEVNQ